MKYLFILFLVAFSLVNCKRHKQPLQIVLNDTIQLLPLEKEESIIFDSLIVKDLAADLQQFYRTNTYKTGWGDAGNREDFIKTLTGLEADGIDSNRYPLTQLRDFHKHFSSLTDDQKIKADFLFSETFFGAVQDVYNGVLNPKKLYDDWDIEPKKINLPATMLLTLEHDAIPIAFDSIRPKNPVYTGLKAALADLKKLPDGSFQKLLTGRKLKLHDSLSEVKELQERLTYWGDLAPNTSKEAVFDEVTIQALKKFQGRNGIDETGLLDAETVKTLNIDKETRIQQVIANLERWRWYPRTFGTHYILVNIPDFNLLAVSNGDTIQKHKIIVGTTKRKTPILSSKFSGLIINPTWTVPPTILKNDLVPAASRNRGYFASRGFTIYDYKGNVISPENWNPEKASSYRYVQKPGRSNSLGRIKFDFKNNHLVYLHDTNNKNNFNKEFRNLSSGCVRVEDPFDLADFILSTEESNYTMKMVNQWLDAEKTQHIPLQKSIEIHQLYWTAWNTPQGIHFIHDTYQLDQGLYNKLYTNSKTESAADSPNLDSK